jgi:integrase
MTVAKSTKQKAPRKPYPGYPLRPHVNGQWCKKIRGVVRFCGVWADPEKAREFYNENRAAWESGKVAKPEVDSDGLTIKQAINEFLSRLEAKADDGDRTRRHFEDCRKTAGIIVEVFDRSRLVTDLRGADFFKLRQRFERKKAGGKASPATVMGHVRRTVAIFRFAKKEGLIDSDPVFGADFGTLSERQKTALQNKAADKLLDPATIWAFVEAAHYRMRAAILLGLNSGLGNSDIAGLELDSIDLDSGWLQSVRSKTAVRRCSWLWPETVHALRVVVAKRGRVADPELKDRVFITRHRTTYSDQSIAREFGRLQVKTGIQLPTGTGFYSLRHTCRTIAEGSADETAKRWIIGHKRSRIEDGYIHAAPRDRIKAVCEFVRNWLLAGKPEAASQSGKGGAE